MNLTYLRVEVVDPKEKAVSEGEQCQNSGRDFEHKLVPHVVKGGRLKI